MSVRHYTYISFHEYECNVKSATNKTSDIDLASDCKLSSYREFYEFNYLFNSLILTSKYTHIFYYKTMIPSIIVTNRKYIKFRSIII